MRLLLYRVAVAVLPMTVAACGGASDDQTAAAPSSTPKTAVKTPATPATPGDAAPTAPAEPPSSDAPEDADQAAPSKAPAPADTPPSKPATPAPRAAPAPAATPLSTAWTHWRGPLQTGVAADLGLPDKWTQDGENLLWSKEYACRSCPVVLGGRVYIIGVAGEKVNTHEQVTCFDAKTGDVLWEHPFNVFHSDIVAARVGWANLAADEQTGYVYAHGVQDLFLCLDADGNVVWSRSLKEEFGAVSGYGGRVHSPIVDEDRVIISFLSSSWGKHGRPLHRYLALDKRTGEVLWWAEPGERPKDTTYSTPVISIINGMRLMIAGNADGNVYAMKARTGETVWKFQFSKRGINASVVVEGTNVYACHGEENYDSTAMGRLVCIDATGTGDVTNTHERWRYDGIGAGYASPALHQGKIYISDDSANLHCFEAESGNLLWTHKLGSGGGRGSTPVWADGKIYVTENQSFLILRPGDQGCETLDEQRFVGQKGQVELWSSPAIVDGRVYFGTSERVYALGITPWSGQRAELLARPAEEPADPGAEPAFLHVVPGEVTLGPGQSQSFEVRAYDNRGRYLNTVPAEYSLAAGLKGELSAQGAFQAAAENVATAGEVQVKVGDLTAGARVRVVPAIPFEEDFEAYPLEAVPPHWGTTPVKFGVAELDGGKVFRKTNVNPAVPVARTIAFIGPPESTGYTISADVRGTEVKFRLPEMGLVNNRYRLMLIATDETLNITSWDALPRIDLEVVYPIEPDTWYRMKFRVDVQEDKALLRGKVWPRDQQEPEEWTIQGEDPMPNRHGSPGLYAYSSNILENRPGTEVDFDNVRVEPNE